MGKQKDKPSNGREEKSSNPVDLASLTLVTTDPCAICLENIVIQGSISCCQHAFCSFCIQQWAKVTNCCPLCKRSFKIIRQIMPNGKESTIKVKSKVQDHQYTIEELDDAIGDDDEDDGDGPVWQFIDREADEASDDEDEEESIERLRKEGYHFYDNLQLENEKIDEESRDSRSIEKSDEDYMAQDQEQYDSDGGFVVDDDYVSYSNSEDSLELAEEGKEKRRRRSSDGNELLSDKSAKKMIKAAKKQKKETNRKDSPSSGDDSSEDSLKKDLLKNFREVMYNRRMSPARKRLRKLAKKLSTPPKENGDVKKRSKEGKKMSASSSGSDSDSGSDASPKRILDFTQSKKPLAKPSNIRISSKSIIDITESPSSPRNKPSVKIFSKPMNSKPIYKLNTTSNPTVITAAKSHFVDLVTPSPSPKGKPFFNRAPEAKFAVKSPVIIPQILSKPLSNPSEPTKVLKRKRGDDEDNPRDSKKVKRDGMKKV